MFADRLADVIETRARRPGLVAEAAARRPRAPSFLSPGGTLVLIAADHPVVPDMERVMAASTLPTLLLGGEVPDDPESAYAGWRKALRLPNVKGLVAGRSLLYLPTTTWPPRSIPR
jgi:hypothetical protein